MPLNKPALEKGIYNILSAGFDQDENQNPKQYFAKIARELSSVIDSYVRSGDVIGVLTSVETVGSATGVGKGGNSGGPVVTSVDATTKATGMGTQSNIGKIQ